jgi:hypothetical protein
MILACLPLELMVHLRHTCCAAQLRVTVVKLGITAIYDEEDELLTLPGEQLPRKFKPE